VAREVGGRDDIGRERFSEVFATEAAFRAWYERLLPRVYGYVYSRCGRDHDLAEDLVQVTFIEAIRGRATFDGRAEPFTWLCGIARHKLADHYRQLDREEARGEQLAAQRERIDPPNEAAAVDERDAIGRALNGLPALQRAVLVFTALDGLTVREAAALVGRSESATESLLHRARVAFREAYRVEESRDG
jgi:RNA polymerase sigma-70 factor (ECF subfamily)